MIYLVANDNGSQIQIVLYREDGNPRDLTGWTVTLKVRRTGASSVLFSITGTATPEQAQDGLTTFTFTGENLARDAGLYELEVSTEKAGRVLTDYPLINLSIREDF